jgi:DNA-binding transcriptional regulator YiaG
VSDIKDARMAAGLTQKGMSDILGIPMRTIEDWEAGRRNCPAYVERLIVKELKGLKEMKDRQGR